ncbi:metal ABC transporter ATPase [Methanosarcina sp. 2.H.T.1A.6]|uniref:plasma-membrane proton-efflux P-type ATPase n=1 Tax=unclassified Methanosarcina TaxID=2644672 RepID=UPI0006221DA5|nr:MULTISPECIES: plasma-membrane proton-efflux P-type ATPase [unclassified Methanosarcina]KKG15650.1 metal ABC transporter ATPase [Methanosarcina sp. 2.H.T.1A.3]KKG24657.1 metal ABC transporter ATPase [Methanosarcina sp. 2.H.T.1A.6]KKG25745.1 metal ABC transporter ATPase [Methanosarcina sp. 2.H.T.1A.8]
MNQNIMSTDEAKEVSVAELLEKLSSSERGLTDSEAKERLQKYGPNEITEKKTSVIVKLLGYFWGPIPWMIEVAAVLSAVLHRWEDFAIILALLLLNVTVGFWQEHKADNAIELLKQKLALKARVRRDNKWLEVSASEIVPGDVIRLRLGDIFPADVKLIDGDYLLVDESALTGESLPVEKHVPDVAYSGSVIRQGEMDALVVATGMNTFFGKTARLVEEAKTRSHFQKAVIKIGDYLIVFALALVAFTFLVVLFRHESMLEFFQFALVLLVAAIPAALPAVLSVSMAVGAITLARDGAIVSKLAAVEEMAGMDILCSDKTGTITKNELVLTEINPFKDFSENDVLLFASLASRGEDRDPIDDAILAGAKTMQGFSGLAKRYRILSFKPFDPVSKRTEATIEDPAGNRFLVTKGATQAISALLNSKVTMDSKVTPGSQVDEYINEFASRGYRALGVGRTDAHGSWHFAGLIALYDPPREDSAETIRTAQSMGVNVKMITGDHIAIAKEISRQVNLKSDIMLATSFLDVPDRKAEEIVENSDGFAQVFPEHKYHIVELLQHRGHIIGMTGDGVNDAPALKKADAGIAVAGATDAAKSAADIVLTKPGLSTIINAIKESRKIFQRMNNYALYRITETIRVLLFITLSILVFKFYPVTSLMIVLLALLNDAPIMTIAYDNVKYSDLPEKWDMRTLMSMATILGIVGVISSFGILYIGLHTFQLTPEVLQSFIYLKLSVAGHLTMFVARTKGHFWSVKPAKPLFTAIVVTQIIATLITVYGFLLPAMGWKLALFVWGYALTAFIITDFIKVWAYSLLNHTGIKFHE